VEKLIMLCSGNENANLLEKAIQLAVEAHRGQRDKAGQPYILHPLRVMLRMGTDGERIVAVLHDVIEDGDWTLQRLQEAGFPDDVVASHKRTEANNQRPLPRGR